MLYYDVIDFYIARPTYCFILMYTCGLTVVIKRICYVMLRFIYVLYIFSIVHFNFIAIISMNDFTVG